ncbi:MAG: S8 family serine peptidase, partial [Gammaproteobacteria bacterium]
MGNVADGFGGSASDSVTVALGINPTGDTLRGTTTVRATGGTATFSTLRLRRAAGYTLTASTPRVGVSPAAPAGFTLRPSSPTQLTFTRQPDTTRAGSPIDPPVQVTLQDSLGNAFTDFDGTMQMALGSNPTGATLSGSLDEVAADGVATFPNLRVDRQGSSYTLVVSAPTAPVPSRTSDPFTITAGVATNLVFTEQPSSAQAGSPIRPGIGVKVSVQDDQGNTDTTSTAPITLKITAGSGTSGAKLGAGVDSVTRSAVNGVATFTGLSIDSAGQVYTLTATSPGLTTRVSTGFDIDPGPAAKLAVIAQPTQTAAGAMIAPSVRVAVLDALGNVVDTPVHSVTVAITSGTGNPAAQLTGTVPKPTVGGIAVFDDLRIDKTSQGFPSYTLTATSGILASATSAGFSIIPGAPARLVFSTQPSTSAAGATISPPVRVTVQDVLGNTVIGATNPITVAIDSNPAGGTLTGGSPEIPLNGIATFNNLRIDRTGTGYRLGATAAGLTGATSNAFDIRPAPAVRVAFIAQPPG